MAPSTWHIYHISNCHHAKPLPKDKFVVIVYRALNPWGFFINSDIRQFVQNQPDLLICQVSIQAKDYKFLDHDSYIDCTDLFPFEDTELVDGKAQINDQTKADIKKAVAVSKTITVRHQKLIVVS